MYVHDIYIIIHISKLIIQSIYIMSFNILYTFHNRYFVINVFIISTKKHFLKII